jgi:hypothetical protein
MDSLPDLIQYPDIIQADKNIRLYFGYDFRQTLNPESIRSVHRGSRVDLKGVIVRIPYGVDADNCNFVIFM